jgi:hypothetical protein
MINDSTPTIFDPCDPLGNRPSIYAFLDENGRSLFGRETFEELRSMNRISSQAVILPNAEAYLRFEEAQRVRLCNGAQPVTAERFDEALNCMPPLGWVRMDTQESFRLCEPLTNTLSTFYVRVGEQFWEINEQHETTHEALVAIALGLR